MTIVFRFLTTFLTIIICCVSRISWDHFPIPPTMTTSTAATSLKEEGMSYANLANFTDPSSIFEYHDGSLFPDVLFSQLL
jgi:hypothetical protein